MSRPCLLVCICLLLGSCAAPPAALATQATSHSAAAAPGAPPSDCPVTRPPEAAFVPPAPYPAKPPPRYTGQFWYGTPDLWTMLGADGTWSALPKSAAGYTQKVFWWRQGYSSAALTVTGKRLDGPATPITADKATSASADFGDAMLVGIEIPTPGCWEITGHYDAHELSFVVWVEP